ncbi:MAG: hypothetical protein ACLTSX_10555 [Collinsella sp.]
MKLAGDKRIVAFVNNRAARPWCEPNNQALSDAAGALPDNVILIDWFGAQRQPQRSVRRRRHPPLKRRVRPNTFSSSIDQVARYLPVHLEDGDDERLTVAQRTLDSLKTACTLDLKPIEMPSK